MKTLGELAKGILLAFFLQSATWALLRVPGQRSWQLLHITSTLATDLGQGTYHVS